jgi:hypothetical protein
VGTRIQKAAEHDLSPALGVPLGDARRKVQAGQRGVQELGPVNVDAVVARFVADGAAGNPGFESKRAVCFSFSRIFLLTASKPPRFRSPGNSSISSSKSSTVRTKVSLGNLPLPELTPEDYEEPSA